jgi:hypothetical protein
MCQPDQSIFQTEPLLTHFMAKSRISDVCHEDHVKAYIINY